MSAPDDVLAVVSAHLDAFNARDAEAVTAGLAEDAVFSFGDRLLVGRRSIAEMFAQSFAQPLRAQLQLRRAVVDGDTAACELVERLQLDGSFHELSLATFFTVRDGRLVRVKTYRDGL